MASTSLLKKSGAKKIRAASILSVLKAMKKRAKSQNKLVRKSVKELGKLLEGREDITAEGDDILDRHLENIESYSSDLLDLRFELKEQITRDEWGQIFSEE